MLQISALQPHLAFFFFCTAMSTPIPAHIASLWNNNDKIAAIKRLREETGLGLAEAKEALESQLDDPDDRAALAGSLAISAAIEAALVRGDKIVAIKLLKDATGIGLKEAKDRIESGDSQQWQLDALLPSKPSNDAPPTQAKDTAAADWTAPGHEPGRVQSSGTWVAMALIAVVLALAGWYLLRA